MPRKTKADSSWFTDKGPSISYVVRYFYSGGSPKDNLLHRPYVIKRRQGGGGWGVRNCRFWDVIVCGQPLTCLGYIKKQFKLAYTCLISSKHVQTVFFMTVSYIDSLFYFSMCLYLTYHVWSCPNLFFQDSDMSGLPWKWRCDRWWRFRGRSNLLSFHRGRILHEPWIWSPFERRQCYSSTR